MEWHEKSIAHFLLLRKKSFFCHPSIRWVWFLTIELQNLESLAIKICRPCTNGHHGSFTLVLTCFDRHVGSKRHVTTLGQHGPARHVFLLHQFPPHQRVWSRGSNRSVDSNRASCSARSARAPCPLLGLRPRLHEACHGLVRHAWISLTRASATWVIPLLAAH